MLRWLRRKSHTKVVIDLWNAGNSRALDYYTKAEADNWIKCFWVPGSRFRNQFDRLDLTAVLDLACGKGRHTAQFISRAGHITCFDTSPIAIRACKARFADRTNVSYVLSESGRDLSPIPDQSMTAVFSYDAMVHFDQECVFGYLREVHRVLRPGGLALLHFSAYTKHPRRDFRSNPDWRAYMSEAAFRDAAQGAEFRIEYFEKFPWSNTEVTDALALLAKT